MRLTAPYWLGYRALFTWLNPLGYVSTRLVQPVATALLFVGALSVSAGSVNRPVFGTALLATVSAVMFGVTLLVGNDDEFGTLDYRILTSQRLSRYLVTGSLPHMLDALLSSLVVLSVVVLIFQITVPASAFPVVLAALLAALLGGIGLGLLCGAIALRGVNLFLMPNIIGSLLVLTSGAIVAPDQVAEWLGPVGTLLPINAGVEAVLVSLEQGETHLAQAYQLVLAEALVGCAWIAVGGAALHVVFRRRRAG